MQVTPIFKMAAMKIESNVMCVMWPNTYILMTMHANNILFVM